MLAMVGLGVWLFFELASAANGGATRAFDERWLLALRDPLDRSDPLGPPWLEVFVRAFTVFGDVGVVGISAALLATYLATRRRFDEAFVLVASVAGAMAICYVVKHGYARPRPDLVPHGTVPHSPSFPSGHATLATALYFTIGSLVARRQARWAPRILTFLGAAMIVLGIAATRLYLGVHWPTDVIAGCALGTAWALLCGSVWRIARHPEISVTIDGARRAA